MKGRNLERRLLKRKYKPIRVIAQVLTGLFHKAKYKKIKEVNK
jgi:hypothetical protein